MPQSQLIEDGPTDAEQLLRAMSMLSSADNILLGFTLGDKRDPDDVIRNSLAVAETCVSGAKGILLKVYERMNRT